MINKVTLIGNVGKDPERRTLDNGQEVATISLATNENYRDKSGEWQTVTEWHKVVCWGKLAEKTASLTKGSLVYVEGKLTTRKWTDKDGVDRYMTEVVANYFRNIASRDNQPQAAKQAPHEPVQQSVVDADDTDLPF